MRKSKQDNTLELKKAEIIAWFESKGARVHATNNSNSLFIEMPDATGYKIRWGGKSWTHYGEYISLSDRHDQNSTYTSAEVRDITVYPDHIDFRGILGRKFKL
jgi:hypothetical protein